MGSIQLRAIYYIVPSIIFIGILLIEWLAIMASNGGVFSYALDDPYIHLSLAKHIGLGEYTLNQGEHSSPSSSILWPFLLVPLSAYPWFEYVPLLLNSLCSLCVLWIFASLFLSLSTEEKLSWNSLLLLCLLIPALNLIGLVFIGMEHSLQMLLSVLLVYGLITEIKNKLFPTWLSIVIIAGPLIRYENLALSIPSLIFLFYHGHYKKALMTSTILIFLLCSFSAFLVYLGEPPLAASILNKMSIAYHASFGALLMNQFIINLGSRQCSIFMCYLGFFLGILNSNLEKSQKQLFVVMISSLSLHLFFGKFDWFNRYELYLHASVWLVIFYIYFNYASKPRANLGYYLLITALTFSSLPYFKTPIYLAKASNNIFSQQYQMRQFVLNWVKSPVAVNDIGWISFNNPYYVLDLWGLGNYSLYKERVVEKTADWMIKTSQVSHTKLAMIYDEWFKVIPQNWHSLGCLFLKAGPQLYLGGAVVHFYATDSQYYSELKQQVTSFIKELPKTAEFSVDCERKSS